MARHLLAVYVDKRHSALAALCAELARWQVDIISLNATHCDAERASWVQFVFDIPDDRLETFIKRLNRLVDVVCVIDLTGHPAHQRVSMFVTLRTGWRNGAEIMELIYRMRADTVEGGGDRITVFVSTTPESRANVMRALLPFGVAELVESVPFGTRRILNLRRRPSRSLVGVNRLQTQVRS